MKTIRDVIKQKVLGISLSLIRYFLIGISEVVGEWWLGKRNRYSWNRGKSKEYLVGVIGLFLIGISLSMATHWMGMDVHYQCIGQDTYRIWVTWYKDCSGSNTCLPDSPPNCGTCSCMDMNFKLFPSGCAVPVPLGPWIAAVTEEEISPICPSAQTQCSNPNASISGVQRAIYFRDYYFGNSPRCDSVIIELYGFTRNGGIINIQNSFSVNLYTGVTKIDLTVGCNSSPVFSELPVVYVCLNQPFVFKQDALDVDGDSLSYALGPCWDYLGTFPNGTPTVVPYQPPYSAANPMASDPPVSVDPITGEIFMFPMQVQKSTMCLYVTEWRNGVPIGRIMRDIQVNVVDCGNQVQPQIAGIDSTWTFTDTICAHQPVSFEIPVYDMNLSDSITMGWDNGIPSATVTIIQPRKALFQWDDPTPQTKPYMFTVYAKDNACPIEGKTQKTFMLYVVDYNMLNDVGSYQWDIGDIVDVDSLKNIYLAGRFRDSIDVLPGVQKYYLYAQDTGYEVFVAKYNNNGSLLWARRMGGGGVIWVSDLEVDKQGRVYVTGGFKDSLDVDSMVFSAIGGVDGYVVVFDTLGNLIESHRLGGNGDEWVEDLVLKGSQWQLLGVFTDSVDIGGQWLTAQGLRDFYVVSWDSLRQIQWHVQEGGGTGEVVAKYLTKDKEGRLYVGGYFTGSVAIGGNVLTSAGGKDVFVYSIDSTGQFRWVLSGGGKGDEEGELAALEDEEARIQIVGSCGDSAVFGMDTLYSYGGRDVLWLAVDTSGQWLWARNIGGKGEDWGEAIAVHNGSVYIGGNFSDTVDFALGVMEVKRVSNGGTDMFVGQYRSDGVLSGLLTIGGDSNDVLRGLAIGSDGSLYLTGGYQDTVDFSEVLNSCISVARGSMDYFLARYSRFRESYGLVDTAVCDMFYVSPWGDTLYQSGVYVDTLMNVYGGDSVLTVSLEMVEIDTSVLVVGDTLYAVGGYEVYRWLRCDSGYVVVASGDSVYVPVVSGLYAVEISHRGCVDTSGCRRVLLSVEEGIGGLRVYPNPVGTLLYVDFGGVVGGVRLQLVDGVGRVVWEGVYEGVSRVVVPLGRLPSGMYWLRVVLGGRVGVYKVVRY